MHLLLVEDNEIIGNALRDHVLAAGWSVDWAVDLKSGRAALETERHYTLILLDLHLPDGSGLDLLARIGKWERSAPVIILSAYDQVSDRMQGMKLGAVDYLVKPFDLNELVARVNLFAGYRANDPHDKRATPRLVA